MIMKEKTPEDYMRMTAYKNGYAKGYKKGYAKGFSDGVMDTTKVTARTETEQEQLHDVITNAGATSADQAAEILGWRKKRARRVWDEYHEPTPEVDLDA